MEVLSSSELKIIDEMRPILDEIEQHLTLGKKAIFPIIQVRKIKKIARFHQHRFARFSEGPLAEKLRPKQNSLFKLLLYLNSSDKKGGITETILSIILIITMFTFIIALTMFIGKGISSIHTQTTQTLPFYGLFWVIVFIIQNWQAKKALTDFEQKLDSFSFELEYMSTMVNDEVLSQDEAPISLEELDIAPLEIMPKLGSEEDETHR